MTRKTLQITTFFLLLGFLYYPFTGVYGHGWGTDRISSIKIDDREISISVEIPPYFEKSENKEIKIKAIDKKTKEKINNITFLIGLFHDDKVIFRNYFFAADGDLTINVIPTSNGKIEISGEKDSLLGAWYSTDSKPIEVVGPVFQSGGLFHFEIEIRTIDEPDNVVEDLGTYTADVSMLETTSYDEQTKDGDHINFRTKSYFDKVMDFSYDSEKNIINFKMPFDWNEKTVLHIPVVHVEVHFPKSFPDFLTPGYTGKVNGIELFQSSIVIDDYTEEHERTVHFILLQDHLQFLKNNLKKQGNLPVNMVFTLEPSDQVRFPMTAMTSNEEFQIDLSWEPLKIETTKKTKFIFSIRNGITGETLTHSSYNFVILQGGNEVYRTSGSAVVGGYFEEFTFEESQTGPTIIRFENIRGSGQSTEFGLVVVPEFGSLSLLTFFASMLIFLILYRKKYSKILPY